LLDNSAGSVRNSKTPATVNSHSLLAGVLCNTAEDKLLSQLLERNLLSIPAAHHLGQPLHLNVQLWLKKIVNMVRF